MYREEKGGEGEDVMKARKENEEKYSVYFWRQKKTLSDAVIQEVEEDPREEGVSGILSRSYVSRDTECLRPRLT